MFGGATNNPYDEIVVKTTDETLTSENWELILNLCDKVQDEGPEGAHNVVAALLKRLTHRNPNVQLYALSLAEALSKNCSVELHRELASRAWTQGLERVITDRNTHDKVRTRALGLVALWTAEFAHDSTLGVMSECYESLKAKNYKYTRPDTPPPPAIDDAIRRREEEELQRVLEMSVRDRGGRQPYGSPSTSGAGGSASTYNNNAGGSAAASGSAGGGGGAGAGAYAGGYTPAPAAAPRERTPSPVADAPSANGTGANAFAEGAIITRVRALHPFTPTEAGELGFEKGDVIKVVDRGYRDWWRGQLRGRTGIFPVNYVEPLPEPTPSELAAEAAGEAAVFAQAVNVERLLNMLRALDPSKGDNLADDEEIQELYRSCMALRPKIVKLIDKYSQKRADLVSMNETFVRARTIFDRMMEESLARHSGGVYGGPGPQQQPYGYPGAPGYDAAAAYQYAQQQQQGLGQGQPPAQGQAGYGVYGPTGPTPYPAQQQQGPQQGGASPYPAQGQQQGPTPYPAQSPYPAQQQGPAPGPYPAQQQQGPAQQQQPQAAQPVQQQQAQPVQQQQQQPQPAAAQQAAQPEPEPAAQQPQPQAAQAGPPYVYDPSTTYADPNVQAWAQYYAAGGKDLAGSVYFVSIPGVTEGAPPAGAAGGPAQAQAQAQQQEQQQREQEQAAAAAAAQQQAQQQAQQAAAAQAQQQAQQAQQAAAQQQAIQQQQLQAQQAQQAQLQAQQLQQQQAAQAAAQQQQQQQQRSSYESPTSPIDDDEPGYFPDPYANQPEGAYATPALQPDYQPQHLPTTQQTPGELAHALGPQPQKQQQQYQGYALADPGAGAGSAPVQRQGYSLTDPGAAPQQQQQPSSPVAAAYPGGAPGGGPGGSPVRETAATPSWVLPKKTPVIGAGPGRGAGSPQPGQQAGLSGQFAGMHV
ncbi:hypothetical protein C8R46DRAFT_1116440 [Mycena filopes]|nr:hypothetical protein C8R46DRAFT_1116440 [Mycena filopes]